MNPSHIWQSYCSLAPCQPERFTPDARVSWRVFFVLEWVLNGCMWLLAEGIPTDEINPWNGEEDFPLYIPNQTLFNIYTRPHWFNVLIHKIYSVDAFTFVRIFSWTMNCYSIELSLIITEVINSSPPGQNGCNFHRQHFQMYFHEWKIFYFDKNFTEVYS